MAPGGASDLHRPCFAPVWPHGISAVRQCFAARPPYLLLLPAFAAVGFFWLFVVVPFEDRKVSPITLAPAAVLIALSVLAEMTPPQADDVVWDARDLVAAAIAIHAAVVILRS